MNTDLPAMFDRIGLSADRNLNVYIWDVDETLILLRSLMDGTFARSFSGSKDVRRGIEIGKQLEQALLQLCDDSMFYEQIEDMNEPTLRSLSEYDDGRDLTGYDFSSDGLSSLPYDGADRRKLAYRHRVIAHRYSEGLNNFLDKAKVREWDDLYYDTDRYTDGWLSSSLAFLKELSSENHLQQNIHVLVTNGSLIPTLAKCSLFRMDEVISHENVYSSSEVGKLQCFKWIKERFSGPRVQFCAIGDGIEESRAAEEMRWPFVNIDMRPRGGTHRFPGLTRKTLENRIALV